MQTITNRWTVCKNLLRSLITNSAACVTTSISAPVLLFNANVFKEVMKIRKREYQYAGLYDLRLKISQKSKLVHINEYLYTEVESDKRKSGEKQFDYVDPKNRQVQIEMEQACPTI